jgi:hypothetical protein
MQTGMIPVNGREPESCAGEVSESRLEKALDRHHVRFPGVLAERHRQFLDISLTQPQAKIGYARPAVSSPSAQNRLIFAVCDASQPFRCRLRTLRVSTRFKLATVRGRGLSTFSTLAVHVRRWRCHAFISLCGTVNFTRINPTSLRKCPNSFQLETPI